MAKKGKGMESPRGMYSFDSNPLGAPNMVEPCSGPILGSPANADQMKVRGMRKQAYMERDYLRGKNSI